MPDRECVDCRAAGITTRRPTPYGGPRTPLCASHHRQRRRTRRQQAHTRHIGKTYGITQEQYEQILEYQGGRCAICQRATGRTRRLAVDHDHACTEPHPPEQGCIRCTRGLLDSVCNRVLIGRYNIEDLQRAIDYLRDPPAQRVLKNTL